MSTNVGTGTSVVCSVAPMLSVRNGARAVEFYKAAFGAIEVYRVEDPGGSVVSRLSVDGAEFWLSDESPEHGNFSPESLGGGTARMILTRSEEHTSELQSPCNLVCRLLLEKKKTKQKGMRSCNCERYACASLCTGVL